MSADAHTIKELARGSARALAVEILTAIEELPDDPEVADALTEFFYANMRLMITDGLTLIQQGLVRSWGDNP